MKRLRNYVMNKIKTIVRIVDVIEELHEYNKLSRYQRFLNFWRKLFKMKPIENIVINPERRRVLERRVARLKRHLN